MSWGCRYKAGESLAALARSVELPQCLLIRRFLEFIPEANGLVSTHLLRLSSIVPFSMPRLCLLFSSSAC